MISDRNRQLKYTKEDSKKFAIRLPQLDIVRSLQLCFNIKTAVTTL